MSQDPRDDRDRYPREVRRKADRMARARAQRGGLLHHVLHVGTLGFLFVLPLVAGAIAGHAVGRALDARWPAFVGLGIGLAAGGYLAWRQIERGLAEDGS